MFKIDESIGTAYPSTKMGILVMKDVAYFGLCTEAQMAQDLDELRRKYSHLDRKELKALPPVDAYAAHCRL